MKILLISFSDSNGAGKACIKVRNAIKQHYETVDIWVFQKKSNLPFIYEQFSFYGLFVIKINRLVSKIIKILFFLKYKNFISYELFESNLYKKINKSDYNVVQLNWVNNFVTVGDIEKINKKIVWRFSDMWPFLGVNHFLFNDGSKKFWKDINLIKKKSFLNFDLKMWEKKRLCFLKKNFE